MHTGIYILIFLAGFVILYFGAEGLVRGASSIARQLGIRPVVIGLTVIAFGTSAPEFFVSFVAALKGVSDIAVGNVVGSNISNIGLVLGLSALLYPYAISRTSVSRELVISIAASLIFLAMARNMVFGRLDGIVLLAGIVLFTGYCILAETRRMHEEKELPAEKQEPVPAEYSRPVSIVMVIAGLVGLVGGARLMTDSAIVIAQRLGVSELAIGLTVVALGTSLPEMAASVVAVKRGEAEMCVGNILGSNIFNLFLVIGGSAVVNPMPLEKVTLYYQIPIMIAFSLAIIPSIFIFQKAGRMFGALLLGGYVAFVVFAFIAS